MTRTIYGTESEVQAKSVERLRAAGWKVLVTAQDRATRRQVAGLPDALAFRDNHTLLLEFKGQHGTLRESQIQFKLDIRPHEGENLRYLVIYHPLQLPKWATK